MSDLNNFCITGRLTADAQRKTFGVGGKAFLEFSVANNTGYGEYAKAQFFRCMLLGDKRADSLLQYLTKGKQVALSGELESNDYTSKDGQKVKDWKFKVNNLVLLSSGSQKGQSNGGLFSDSLEDEWGNVQKNIAKEFNSDGKDGTF